MPTTAMGLIGATLLNGLYMERLHDNWLENAASSSGGRLAHNTGSLKMSLTFVVSNERLIALPR